MPDKALSRLETIVRTRESFDKSIPLCYTESGIILSLVWHLAFISVSGTGVARNQGTSLALILSSVKQSSSGAGKCSSTRVRRALMHGKIGCWGVPLAHPFVFQA